MTGGKTPSISTKVVDFSLPPPISDRSTPRGGLINPIKSFPPNSGARPRTYAGRYQPPLFNDHTGDETAVKSADNGIAKHMEESIATSLTTLTTNIRLQNENMVQSFSAAITSVIKEMKDTFSEVSNR